MRRVTGTILVLLPMIVTLGFAMRRLGWQDALSMAGAFVGAVICVVAGVHLIRKDVF